MGIVLCAEQSTSGLSNSTRSSSVSASFVKPTHQLGYQCAGSVWGKMSSWLGKSPSARIAAGANMTAEEDPECVHIFTVASGLMYERLQKIMVLSVLRNTR